MCCFICWAKNRACFANRLQETWVHIMALVLKPAIFGIPAAATVLEEEYDGYWHAVGRDRQVGVRGRLGGALAKRAAGAHGCPGDREQVRCQRDVARARRHANQVHGRILQQQEQMSFVPRVSQADAGRGWDVCVCVRELALLEKGRGSTLL